MAEPRYDIPDGVGRFLLEERFGQNFAQPAAAATPAPPAAPTAMDSGIGSLPVGPDFPTLYNSGAQSLDERAMEDLQDYYDRTGTGPNLNDGLYRSQPPDDYYDNKPPAPKPSDELGPPDYTPVDTRPPDDSGYTEIPPNDVIIDDGFPPMSSYTPVPPPSGGNSESYTPAPPPFDPRIPQPPMYTPVPMFPQTKTLFPPGRRYPSNMVEQIVYEEKQTNPLYTPIYTSGVFSGG